MATTTPLLNNPRQANNSSMVPRQGHRLQIWLTANNTSIIRPTVLLQIHIITHTPKDNTERRPLPHSMHRYSISKWEDIPSNTQIVLERERYAMARNGIRLIVRRSWLGLITLALRMSYVDVSTMSRICHSS